MTYTYATLEVSHATYAEIKAKLEAAGYQDQFHEDAKDGVLIDMHGLALKDSQTRKCRKCKRIFTGKQNRKQQLYCSDKCSHSDHSIRSHSNDVRKNNWDLLRKVASKLRQRLDSRDSKAALADLASGRWLNRFVRAAEGPRDSLAREELVELCTSYGNSETHKQEVRTAVDGFLGDIRRALKIQRQHED